MSEQTKPKPTQISVEVDTKRTEELARENERLRIEKQQNDIEEKLAKAEADRIAFMDTKTSLAEKTGDPSFNEVKTKEELKEKMEGLLKLGVQKQNEHGDLAGSAPMNPQQLGSSIETDDIYRKKFGSYDDMIRALRNESKSEDKQKAQHANLVLNALLNKYAVAQKQIHEENRYCEDDAIPKTDKVPTIDFSQANESFSELERFGIHKSPLNYSRNQRKIIAQKGKESE